MKTVKISIISKSEKYFQLMVPAIREVCSRCDGSGVHDPAAFSNGFTGEELDQDPDFRENYFSGRYDVRCEVCNGRNVVDVPDLEFLENKYPRILNAFYRNEDERAAHEAECAMERRMGA